MTRLKRHLNKQDRQVHTPSTTVKIRQNKKGEYLLKRGNKTVVAGPFLSTDEALAALLVMAIRGE